MTRLGVRLRPEQPDDQPVLLALYAGTRADELAPVPWATQQKHAFLASQFHTQAQAYRQTFPAGRFLVVELDGRVAGRLYVADIPDGVELVDVALFPEHRGRGIGTALVAGVVEEADAAGLAVTLHVEHANPARRLYERFGFAEVEAGPVYVKLVRPARLQPKTAS